MKPKTVLVVEDEPKYATPLCRFLKRKGFQVVHARTGSGLRHLLATRADLRLVLLDLQLSTRSRPGDGIENILYIRRLYPIIPIIVLTNHVDPINVVPAIRAGATDLIQKSPEYTTEFLELIVEPKLRRQLSLKIGEDFHHIRGKLTGLSENVLIKRVIIPLFRKLGYSALPVRHHGPGEEGMDILPFYKLDEFGQRIFSAAQVKATDVHANHNRSGNLTGLLNQARTALSAPLLDPDKCLRTLDRFYLITSGELTMEASRILRNQIQGDRRITVIDGNKLTELLMRYDMSHIVGEASACHKVGVYMFHCDLRSKGLGWEPIIKRILRELQCIPRARCVEIYNRLLEREQVLPTVLGDPFALPHAHIHHLTEHVIILLAVPKRLDWLVGYKKSVQFVAIQLSAGGETDITSRQIRLALMRIVGSELKRRKHYPKSTAVRVSMVHKELISALKKAAFRVSAVKHPRFTL